MKVYDVLKKYYFVTPVKIKECYKETGEIKWLSDTIFNIQFSESEGRIRFEGEVGNVPYYLAHFKAIAYNYDDELLRIFVEG